MRKSIFDLEFRIDIDHEFKNIKNILDIENSIVYNGTFYSLYDLLNDEIFPIWKYKGISISFEDFCDRLNIDLNGSHCTEEKFLFILELLYNLWMITELKLDPDHEHLCNAKVVGYMRINLPLIIEKMNYQILEEKDKFRLVKRDADVDSILEIVPKDKTILLLDYNDIRNNNIKAKTQILKQLDLFIEENKKDYSKVDVDTYTSIQYIVNNMGINHPIKKEPFKSYDDYELIKWYDKCFKLIIHIIRKKEVNEINKERKTFDSD